MEIKDLEKFRSSLIAEKQMKIEEINLRYKKKLEALDVLLDNDLQLPLVDSHAEVVKSFNNKVQSVFQAVREAIAEVTKTSQTFSSETLFQFINAKYPNHFAKKPSDLSGVLWRLKKANEIMVLSQGIGQVASTYKKTDQYGAA